VGSCTGCSRGSARLLEPAGPVSSVPPTETALIRRGLWLARFTVAYNVVEGAVAVAAGLVAGLVSVVGFGVDSGIESMSALLVWARLSARLRDSEIDLRRERRALRLIAITFFVLAAYVTVEGVRALVGGDEPESSPVSIVLLMASIVVMPVLAAAKHRVGVALGGDRLILADAAETRICVFLSISTLLGVVLFQVTGAAWLDPVAGFVIAGVAVREGLEAWEGELVEAEDA
jgi:divalent metal cation (Fe/Co/Zn/Cd) transporter